ncbi:MAG: methionine adenosyltransferase [Thermodesulfobacteriota bacterium]|nr:methionine adenosyltransferase [Thermodesulfobacteriota bacterium]
MKKDFIFTSASVTEGHPDKLCDLISDAIVDRYLREDPYAYIEAECSISQSIVFIAAQFSSTAVVDMPQLARDVITQTGYTAPPFSGKNCTVLTCLKEFPLAQEFRYNENALTDEQISCIPVRHPINAFGYACTQTASLMPLPIWLAHKLARRFTTARCTGVLPYFIPDGKIWVAVAYRAGKPWRIHSITFQISCDTNLPGGKPSPDDLRHGLLSQVVEPTFRGESIRPDNVTRTYIETDNPLVSSGPSGHSGLTGRKNAVDTYGEFARHSGSSLSGKSPQRIDRIGAYAARYVAKNIVAAGLADECEIQVSYSVGFAEPDSIQVETFETGQVDDSRILRLVKENFDLRPASIVRQFQLRHLPKQTKGGFYKKLGAYGHLGRMDIFLPWERTDKVKSLRSLRE